MSATAYISSPTVSNINDFVLLFNLTIKTTSSLAPVKSVVEQVIDHNKVIFNKILHLQPGWDGYQGKSFNAQFVQSIRTIVDLMENPPIVFAGGNGQLQLEFHKDEHNYTEIEVNSESVQVLHVVNDEVEETEFGFDQIETILRKFSNIYTRRNS